MWYCKMYFSGEREVFEYDSAGIQSYHAERQELPFLESLLTFLEMDIEEPAAALRRIGENWSRFCETGDRQFSTDAMVELGALSNRHVYFQVLYRSWYDHFSSPPIGSDDVPEDFRRWTEELRQLPEQLAQYQKQIQRFFDLVLDVDSAGREPQRQASAYYAPGGQRDPWLFRFRPIPVSFEAVEPGRCSPVLYSASIADMIDYSLRGCVERGITVRRCKNCGRWFPQTGRISAEYCARPVAEGEELCRDTGAFRQWAKKESGEPVFKAYRREYKKRFAWIKAGRITDKEFKAWSVEARKRKKACDREEITLEEYQQWLRES